jgi:type IV fimbrial biogenesis protein FimT
VSRCRGHFSVQRRASRNGVSLLECLLVCTLVAVLAMKTMPAMSSLLDRVRVNRACSDFHEAILRARVEAIRRHERVDLVPAAGLDWRSGWVVLIDTNNNHQLDPGELSLYRVELDMPKLQVEAKLRDARFPYLAFAPSGRPRSANSASVPQIGSVLFTVGAERRKLVMSFLGRTRVCDPDATAATC